ncbi:lysylphosphatidylglycerol synthase transmembrane domain-containing protein [Cellulomonas sp. ATA003]|uniref:lysylphosphatidylglycerol synthase transmembrane domain-containing protein n=1 Tax=Cellulomonas sp. ATA003 TaxID=3073064 RepID=UPI0028734F30|nr:lysylphosphatidylglycerol synthase transmembrane domain-containing protein [Cellulomonas sp. ATA003]WNB85671.1 lysylphosphatidylglycerol synthase transmembrane domain-containing protein [Cellulomonas sp. ATA003]
MWITRWENGDVASNQLSRRMDLTQMLALLAVRVGAARALQSAVDVLPADDVAAIGPLLQTPALPRRTREEVRAHPKVLTELRSALVELLPDADVQPEQLLRFGARTLITILLTVVAVYIVLTTVNVEEITEAIAGSDWRWSVVAFGLGLLTFPGAALAFVAFAPIRLPVWRATLVQAAGAFVALAAPAGIGPAALNLRMLNRRGVTASLSVATVALVQVSQFVVTVLLLLLLSVISGTSNAPRFTPSPTLLLVIGIVAALVASSLLVPAVRTWVAAKTLPTVRQTWPRLIAVVGHPWRMGLAVGGNVVMTMGYVLAFDACLAAFGQDLTLVQVALIYLVGNAAGAAVPTPGGIGTIEIALTTGLTAGGLNPGVAASVALLFRVLTYWLRIPIGWVAMRVLQRAGDL